MKRLRRLFFAVFFVLVGSQLLLPQWAQRTIEQNIEKSIVGAQSVEVKVRAFPALRLLFGRADTVDIRARSVRLDDVTIDTLHVIGDDLHFGSVASFRLESPDRDGGDDWRVVADISEQSLGDYIQRNVPQMVSVQVRLTEDGAALTGEIGLLGHMMHMDVTGNFSAGDGGQFVFLPKEVSVEGARLPDMLMEAYTQPIVIPIRFPDSGWSLSLDRVDTYEGRVRLDGTLAGAWGR